MLCGIDEAIFNNVFAVGLRELQELGTLDDTEAAAQLYKLTSGLDRVSLLDVMRDTTATRNRILAADGSESELLNLLRQREKLQGQIQEAATRGERWGQLAAQRKELQDEVLRLEESIERMERESRAVEVALQIREPWFRRIEVQQGTGRVGPAARIARAGGPEVGRVERPDSNQPRTGRPVAAKTPRAGRRGRRPAHQSPAVGARQPDRGHLRAQPVDRVAGKPGQAPARRNRRVGRDAPRQVGKTWPVGRRPARIYARSVPADGGDLARSRPAPARSQRSFGRDQVGARGDPPRGARDPGPTGRRTGRNGRDATGQGPGKGRPPRYPAAAPPAGRRATGQIGPASQGTGGRPPRTDGGADPARVDAVLVRRRRSCWA